MPEEREAEQQQAGRPTSPVRRAFRSDSQEIAAAGGGSLDPFGAGGGLDRRGEPIDAKKAEYAKKIIETLVKAGRHISLGYGIHFGWAIEGAIGSNLKIDASYLSPHGELRVVLWSHGGRASAYCRPVRHPGRRRSIQHPC